MATNMKKLCLIAIILSAVYMASAQAPCPPENVCLTRAEAIEYLTLKDTAETLKTQVSARDQAIDTLKTEIHTLKVELAKTTGQLTATQQNEIAQRAIIEFLLKSVKKSNRYGLIVL